MYVESRIASLKEWKSKCSPRFATLFSTRGGPFRLLLPPPCSPASTAPGDGLHGGLLEALCGRRKRRSIRNRFGVGTYAPASKCETLIGRRCDKFFFPIVHKITDKSMICDVSVFFTDYSQSVPRKVQCRQFATHMYSLCVPGYLVATSISRNT